jgi:DNA-binding NarL/FixJ family response regulator
MLTERESEVAALVARGLKTKAVAHHLGVAEGTVKIHLHTIYRKLAIKSRSQLVFHLATNIGHALKARRIGADVVEFPKLLGRKV